jgi:hypothetical protein
MDFFAVLTLLVCSYTLIGYMVIEMPAFLKLRWKELVKKEK